MQTTEYFDLPEIRDNERRRGWRYRISAEVWFRWQTGSGAWRDGRGISKDISGHGICVLCSDVPVHPFTLEAARMAGRIEGQQAAQGIMIAFEDLVIGVTALQLGFDVATLNVRHFRLIPGLTVV